MSITLDADGSGNSSEECAQAIENSLKKVRGSVKVLAGQTTDSGGGGVLHSLKKWLREVGLVDPEIYYVAPCSLHALQISFANPTKLVFGEGGNSLRDVMQLLRSCYGLQNSFQKDETRYNVSNFE